MNENLYDWIGKKVTVSFGPTKDTGKLTRILFDDVDGSPGIELDNGPIYRNWTDVQKN